jgi:hypothetical protein
MYIETPVGKLSKVQLNNLLKGKNVRIKKGTAHTINLSEEQSKKFHRNIRQDKALTIKLTQDQIAKQGGGILGDLIGLVHPTAGKVASMVGLGMKKRGKGIVSDLIGLVHPTAGKVASMVGLGMKKKGKGFLENMAKEAAINMAKAAGKFAIDKGADFAKGKIEGMGIRKKRRATPAQLEALARGRAIRDANRSGGSLMPAGY